MEPAREPSNTTPMPPSLPPTVAAPTPLPSVEARGELTSGFEWIDAATAHRWLGLNRRNRPKKHQKIALYVRDILTDRWDVTGEAIKFDRNGWLLDGQNRLFAIVEAAETSPDVTVHTLVVRGLDPASQSRMDSGAARTAGDNLGMVGVRNAMQVAAAARVALAVEDGVVPESARYTHAEIEAWVYDHVEIADADVADHKMIALPPSVLRYLVWRLSRIDPDDAVRFFRELATGIGVDSEASPVLALRRRLSGESYGAHRRQTATEQLTAVIRAWNAWREGREMRRVIATGDSIPEPL